MNLLDNVTMDELVDNLAKSYNLTPSRVSEIKEGLVNEISSYLESEITKSGFNKSDSSSIILESMADYNSDNILKLMEANESVSVYLHELELLRLDRTSDGINYRLNESLDISKIDADILINSWNSKEPSDLKELLCAVEELF